MLRSLYYRAPLLLAVLLLSIVVPAALSVGSLTLDWRALDRAGPQWTVLIELRLPRVLLAVLIGAALAQAGAVAQAVFRNPLAEPGLLGMSAGAALAAALVLMALPTSIRAAAGAWALPLAAFAGAAIAAVLVIRLADRAGGLDLATLLLAGIAINAFASAIVGLLAADADAPGLRSYTRWMYGQLGRAGWDEIAFAAPPLLILVIALPRCAPTLDALLLGEAAARHLGVEVERAKRRLLLAMIVAVACSVSLAGVIGFIGLVVPHAIRLLLGPGHRRLLPLAAVLGAVLLTLADTAARTLPAPAEWPVGALTAALGAPVFAWLLLRQRGNRDAG